ncbi:hypothetical protein BDY17DRAFT_298406 [Neohortaea acidophila]|uniref:Uncharacterized protein n=1 Tax=Neohortaea acidophila TaxID=245834 RepID=A0A6A6PRS7_9PEZI|nr:uncharacterized protein BDY17DRAFT_298406 [Neohortaea acidophila]KAF2482381.1 hypothetical protein BDY17DRAFT_298406 [Neohortaea acidophila]
MSLRGTVAFVMAEGDVAVASRAKDLAKDGADIALYSNPSQSNEHTTSLRDSIHEAQPSAKITIHSGDLTTAGALEKVFADVLSDHGRIDVVVNSAGMLVQMPTSSRSPALEYNDLLAYAVFVDEQWRIAVEQLDAEIGRT